MDFLAKKLNYIISELDKLYNINSGGCCYLAYRIAYWLELYNIDFLFVIQSDLPIKDDNVGNHYYIQLLPNSIAINKDSKYQFTKSTRADSEQILKRYLESTWSKKYDKSNTCVVTKIIDKVFDYK